MSGEQLFVANGLDRIELSRSTGRKVTENNSDKRGKAECQDVYKRQVQLQPCIAPLLRESSGNSTTLLISQPSTSPMPLQVGQLPVGLLNAVSYTHLGAASEALLTSLSFSQACSCPGSRSAETVNPVKPALGLAPRPVAPSSRISPPEPVEAPGNGEIAVG